MTPKKSKSETPEAVEAAFYAAFENADIEAMMAVWDSGDAIACVHPFSTLLTGKKEIEKSWRGIFANAPAMTFQVVVEQQFHAGDIATHVVHEIIQMQGHDTSTRVIATNIYRRTSDGWRIILHHASPTDARENPPSAAIH